MCKGDHCDHHAPLMPFFPLPGLEEAQKLQNPQFEESFQNPCYERTGSSCCESSAHSSGPEDSGCGTSSCEDIEEIDVESVETSSNENLKSSSFSISNLLKEKSESSKLKPSIFSNPYSHPLYPYSHLPYPLNLFQGSQKIISSISSNYQKPRKSPFEKTQTFSDPGLETRISGIEDKSEVRKTPEKDEHGNHCCDVCGKKFKHIRMLNRHRRNHNPYKKYKCSYCGKGFNDSFDLKRHVRTHTGVKPYKCNQCEKSFTQRCSLESHLDKIHGQKHDFSYKQRREKIYVCEDCGFSTQDVREHYKHSREHHAANFHQNLALGSQVPPIRLLDSPFILTH